MKLMHQRINSVFVFVHCDHSYSWFVSDNKFSSVFIPFFLKIICFAKMQAKLEGGREPEKETTKKTGTAQQNEGRG